MFVFALSAMMTLAFLSPLANAKIPSRPSPDSTVTLLKNWRLAWSEEFNEDGKPDAAKWAYEIGGNGWGNNELEYYTDRPENARVENGNLVIEAIKEDFGGSHYTSARISTQGLGWRYGRYEVRAKLPKGAGIWPAIWMLPVSSHYGQQFWPDNGEIDIMENFGTNPNEVVASFHTKNFNWMTGSQKRGSTTIPNLDGDFHVFSLSWSPKEASMAVDGVTYNVFENPHTDWRDWPFDQRFKIILNFAIGGMGGGDVDDSIFPQRMLVDYVRVYKPTGTPPDFLAASDPY